MHPSESAVRRAQFPREIDSRLIYDADRSERAQFAREKPSVRRHLDLIDRRDKLKLVASKLDALQSLAQDRAGPKPTERRRLFGF